MHALVSAADTEHDLPLGVLLVIHPALREHLPLGVLLAVQAQAVNSVTSANISRDA